MNTSSLPNTNNNNQLLSQSIPLGFTAHAWAKDQCQSLPATSRAEKYLQALALYAVHRYFLYLGIETKVEAGDSQQQFLPIPAANHRNLAWAIVQEDAAQAQMPSTPPEAIGCVVLLVPGDSSINGVEELSELRILGFTPELSPLIDLASLQSTDILLDAIYQADLVAMPHLSILEKMHQVIIQHWPALTFAALQQQVAVWRDDQDREDKLMNWLKNSILEYEAMRPALQNRDLNSASSHPQDASTNQLSPEELRELQDLCYDLDQLGDNWPKSVT